MSKRVAEPRIQGMGRLPIDRRPRTRGVGQMTLTPRRKNGTVRHLRWFSLAGLRRVGDQRSTLGAPLQANVLWVPRACLTNAGSRR